MYASVWSVSKQCHSGIEEILICNRNLQFFRSMTSSDLLDFAEKDEIDVLSCFEGVPHLPHWVLWDFLSQPLQT